MTILSAQLQFLIFPATAADASTRVIAREWQWQPVLSLPIWLVICAVALVLAVVVYRSRRVQLPTSGRIILATLRSMILLLAAGLLLQPTVRLRLERTSPRPLALFLDDSGSMAVRDRAGSPETRWERVLASLRPLMTSTRQSRTHISCFDEQTMSTDWLSLIKKNSPLSDSHTDITRALKKARETTTQKPETQIVLVSDGADTSAAGEGIILAAAREFAQAGLTLHTVLVGNEQLPCLTIEPNSSSLYAFVNDPIQVQTRVTATNLNTNAVNLTITAQGRPLATRRIEFPDHASQATGSFNLSFDHPGIVLCSFQVDDAIPPITLEDTPGFEVHITDQPVRVLYIEHKPRWTFQFLRNAFQRDNRFDAQFVLLGADTNSDNLPTDDRAWSDIDVVILGDVAPQSISSEWWQQLHDAVIEDGVGIILACGPADLPARFLDSTLSDLLPFSKLAADAPAPQQPWPLKLTPAGQLHPIMRVSSNETWDTIPGLYWCAPIHDLKPAAEVLAYKPPSTDSPEFPVMILQHVGRGLVLLVGTDETWRWRYEVGDKFFYRFWAQAATFVGLPHRAALNPASRPTTSQPAEPNMTEPDAIRPRPELLKQLAQTTGGRCVPLRELPKLIDQLEQNPVREQWADTISYWDCWPTLALLVVLLCTEWLLRRRHHLP